MTVDGVDPALAHLRIRIQRLWSVLFVQRLFVHRCEDLRAALEAATFLAAAARAFVLAAPFKGPSDGNLRR